MVGIDLAFGLFVFGEADVANLAAGFAEVEGDFVPVSVEEGT